MSVRDLFGGTSGTYTLPAQGGAVGQCLAYPTGLTGGRNELQWVTPGGPPSDVWHYAAGATPVLCPNPADPAYVTPCDFAVPSGVSSITGAGTRMTFTHTGSLRAGTATATAWDTVGLESVAFGRDNHAQGAQSAAMGLENQADAAQSFAGGFANTVYSGSAHSSILGGTMGAILDSRDSAIVAGAENAINADVVACSAIVAGTLNTVTASNSVVVAGESNQVIGGAQRCATMAGFTNTITGSSSCAIVTGADNGMTGGFASAVLCGTNAACTASRSCVLGGDSISAAQDSTAFAQRLTTLGGRQKAVAAISTNLETLSLDDHVITFSNATGSAMTLYTPAAPVDGQEYWVKVVANNFASSIDCGASHYFLLPDGSHSQSLPILTTMVGTSTHIVYSVATVIGGRTGIWLVLGAAAGTPADTWKYAADTVSPFNAIVPNPAVTGSSSTYNLIVTGDNAAAPQSTGPGNRMVYLVDGAMFRAGHVTGSQWDTCGVASAAFNTDCVATGHDSFACGAGNTAGADRSACIGGTSNSIASSGQNCAIVGGTSIAATAGQTDTLYAQRLATRGGCQKKVTTVTATATLGLDSHIVAFNNTSGGAIVLYMPSTPVDGQEYWIKIIACSVASTIDCGASHYFALADATFTASYSQTIPILTTAIGASTHVVYSASTVLGGRTGAWLVLGTAVVTTPPHASITAYPMFNVLPVASWSGTSLTYTSGSYTFAVYSEFSSTYKGIYASQATKTAAQWAADGTNPNPKVVFISRTTFEPVKYISMVGRLGFGTESPRTFHVSVNVGGSWLAVSNAAGTLTMDMLQGAAGGYTPVAGFTLPDAWMGFSDLLIEFITLQPGCGHPGLSNISLFSPQQTQRGSPWSLYQSQVPYSTVWAGSTTYPYSLLQGIGGFSFYTQDVGWYLVQASCSVIGNGAGAANLFMYIDGSAARGDVPSAYLSLGVTTIHAAAPTMASTVLLQPGLHIITFSSWTTNLPTPSTTFMVTPTAHAFCQAEDQINISITKASRA